MRRVNTGHVVAALGGALILAMVMTLVVGVVRRPALLMYVPTQALPAEVGARLAGLAGPAVYTVDARDPDRWVTFDFSRGAVVPIEDRAGLDWDLAFQRFRIRTNGGATNPRGRGGALDLGPVRFDSVREAPDTAYLEDAGDARRETRNRALERWYEYSWLTHVLKPKPHVYVVRTADGGYAKLEFLSYYCEGSQPGCLTFRYVYAGDGGRSFVPAAADVAN